MATDMGKKLQNRKNISCPLFEKRDALRNFLEWFGDFFLRDHIFREGMLENNRDEDVCLKWNDLAEQDFTYRM